MLSYLFGFAQPVQKVQAQTYCFTIDGNSCESSSVRYSNNGDLFDVMYDRNKSYRVNWSC